MFEHLYKNYTKEQQDNIVKVQLEMKEVALLKLKEKLKLLIAKYEPYWYFK